MLVGIPKEIKNHEYRVGITPAGVKELVSHGHQVIVETRAGAAVGFTDEHYQTAGALIVKTAADVYGKAEMVVKVKEPQPQEYNLIREGQILFCYLHLAAEPELAKALVNTKCIGIAYETITSNEGVLPLLAPMSEVAGRVAVQAGAHCLHKAAGGRGVLLGGVPGVEPGNVVILGGGIVGINSATIASGMGANVTILERSINRIRELELRFNSRVRVVYSTKEAIENYVRAADLVIGAVLIPGSAAPKLVDENLVRQMRPGSVIVDVAVDQGGCIETIRPTTHEHPTYELYGVIHYGVTNMPSAVANTSTRALENSTLPYILTLAEKGYAGALKSNEHFRNGLNVYRGKITHEAVAHDLHYSYTPAQTLLAA